MLPATRVVTITVVITTITTDLAAASVADSAATQLLQVLAMAS